ncbi:hypothetical protein Hsar01_03885 [Haloferula sargassicola]|uniref:Uncharacterized protein n=1 Tax=Haloferula sargassicola TaxID=490096 RepID=A0ABP9UZ36_9BACT
MQRLRSILASGEESYPDAVKAVDELSREDIPTALDSISSTAGIRGLQWPEKNILNKLVNRWYEEDSEAALAWIQSLDHPGNRQFFLEQIASSMAIADVSKAVEFMETHFDASSSPVDFPNNLFDLAAKVNPDLLVRACALSIRKGSSGSAMLVQFPIDFDFAGCLGGFEDLAKRMQPGESISNMPSNLLSSWAKADPQAAYEWTTSIRKEEWASRLPFHFGVNDFFEGYAEASSPETYGNFVAEVLEIHQADPETLTDSWYALAAKSDTATIDSFLNAASREVPEASVIKSILSKSFACSGGSYDSLRSELFSRLSPEVRMEFLQESIALGNDNPGPFNDLARSMISLGYSEEELKSLLKQP